MKPVLNLNEITEFIEHKDGDFDAKYALVSSVIGAKKLGYSYTVVPPGKKVCPFHHHYINEELFLITEGVGLLRFGEKQYELKPMDVISCPPGGEEVAHQIINTGTSDLKYLSLSTNEPYDICGYPDSKKILSYVRDDEEKSKLKHVSRIKDAVNYFEDEK